MILTRPAPAHLYFVALVCFALSVTSLMSSCTRNERQDTLRASILTLNASRDGFVKWDRVHQQVMADHSATREEAEHKLADYRTHEQRDIELGFEVAYKTVAVAATQSDEPSLSAAVHAVTDLIAAVKALIGGAP